MLEISQKVHELYKELLQKKTELDAHEAKLNTAIDKLSEEKKQIDARQASLDSRESGLMQGIALEKEIAANKVTIDYIRKESDDLDKKKNDINKQLREMADWVGKEKASINEAWADVKARQLDNSIVAKKLAADRETMKQDILKQLAK